MTINESIPAEAIAEINRRAIHKAVDNWWKEYVLPRVTGLESQEGLRAVMAQIQICDDERQIMSWPGNMGVYHAFANNQIEFTGRVGYEPGREG